MEDKRISSITDFMKWADSVYTTRGENSLEFSQQYVQFRGQADVEWKLMPSVFQRSEKEEQCISGSTEHTTLRQAQALSWQKLHTCHSELEQMILFQHMELHTRLLDVTSNPLVALHFACADEDSKDGCVYAFSGIGNENIKYAQLLAKILFEVEAYEPFGKSVLEKWAKGIGIAPCSLTNISKILSLPIMVNAPYNNDRIIAQRGAFILFPIKLTECGNDNLQYCPLKTLDFMSEKRENISCLADTRAIIPSSAKGKILDKLSIYGIDESTIYPDFPHLMKAINTNRYADHTNREYKLDI